MVSLGWETNASAGSALEIELHRELNETRIAGGLWLPELRVTKFDCQRFFADSAHRPQQWIDMVPNIEKFGAELEVHLLTNRKQFENRKIPILKARPTGDISTGIAEGEEGHVSGESAGIEQSARQARPSVRVTYHVGPYF